MSAQLSYGAAARRAVVGVGALPGRRLIRGRYGEWRHMIVEAATLVVRENENRILPRIALHERGNDGLHIRGSGLDVVVGMLIQSAAARGAVYENDLGQSVVRVRTRQA